MSINAQTGPVIPPNPIAESFKLYGDIPVSYSTGVPDITIPVYTITVGDFSLPVELRYHINSVRPASCGSNVALGWSLHYGGIVSRTMYGRPDEFNAVNTFGTGVGMSSDFEVDALFKNNDTEKDIFNYDIGGTAGEFVLDNNTPYQMSSHPVAINYSLGNFDITNAKGDVFKFGHGLTETSYVNGTDNAHSAVSSWLLTQIALANNQSINYIYEDVPVYEDQFSSMQKDISDNYTLFRYGYPAWGNPDGPEVCNGASISNNSSSTFSRHYEKNIKEIDFPNGKLVFDLTPDKRRITGVKLYEGNRLVKAFEFQYPATGGYMGDMRLLRNVLVKDANLNVIQQYGFEYYYEAAVDKSAHTDYWGYCNDYNSINYFPYADYKATNFNEVVSRRDACLALLAPGWVPGSGGLSKTPNLTNSLTNVLKKITYPTSGSVTFEYGLNKYTSSGLGVQDGGGLRIEKISKDDGAGHLSLKTYQYEPQVRNEIVLAPNEFANTTYSIGQYLLNPGGSVPDYAVTSARHITYGANINSRIGQSLLNIKYSQVTETIGENGANNGKNVYYFNYNNSHTFTNFKDVLFPTAPGNYVGPSFCLSQYRNWDNGMLALKEVYRKDEMLPFYTTTYNYIYHYDETPFHNTVINKLSSYNPIPNSTTPDGSIRESLWNLTTNAILSVNDQEKEIYYPHVYVYYNYEINTGWLELHNEVTTERTSSGNITTTTEYKYEGAKTFYPSQVITWNSKGLKRIVDNKYPYDFGPTEPYQSMAQKNIIEPVISQQETEVNGATSTILSTRKTNYNNWGNNIFKPSLIEESVGTRPLTGRLQFDSYDEKGNVLQMHKTDDVNETFIWGYNKQLPVARVTNAATKDVFYTSFEEGDGNSTAGDSKTGDKSKTDGFSKSLTGLTDGNYVLSWWQKSGSTWTLTQNTVSIAGGAYNISLTGQVDEVRFRPERSLMTTYTYSPIVGMTTQCDANNRTTHFIYDNFGRLDFIRDQDGNVVKKFSYTYGEAVNPPSVPYQSVQKSEIFTRNNCGTGTGSQVTYTVPAGTYTSYISQADADQQAQNDLIANGLNYANSHGTCTYLNVMKQGTFTRNDCGSGGTGSQVIYTVNAGMYSSMISQADADQKAQNDVNTNGQAYANAHGLCNAIFHSTDHSGYYYSTYCTFPDQPNAWYVSVPAGMFTSTVSQQDADNQAQAYGQADANSNGGCSPPMVNLTYSNQQSSVQFYITLYNTQSQQYYNYTTSSGSGILGQIPAGTYDVTISPVSSGFYNYTVACYYSTSGPNASFYGVSIDASCSSIDISF